MVKTRSRPITSIFHKKGKDNASDENGIPVTKAIKVVEKVKRSAEASPENAPSRKRSAFGDITNATFNQQGDKDGKKSQAKNNVVRKESTRKQAKTTVKAKPKTNKRKSSESSFQQAPAYSELDSFSSSGEISSSQDLIEVSATQESTHSSSSRSEVKFDGARQETGTESALSSLEDFASVKSDSTKRDNEIKQQQAKEQDEDAVPSDVVDIDSDKSDPFTVANYAFEIFQNMKQREELFPLTAFMETQPDITPNMRSILVDWLVEVQECFELYHETLYLAVKLLDHFLEKNAIKREELQLVGATTLIIASKIEERHPPCMDDFIYICDDAYQQPQFIAMESKIILSLGFDINIPIPYRFLRRYAKAAFANIETLTLARFILESSLLESKFIPNKASFMAASCLYLALLMKGNGEWTPTLVHHTGYTKDQLRACVLQLNSMNAAPPNKNLMTVRSKYSHKVFHEVAKIPALDTLTIEV